MDLFRRTSLKNKIFFSTLAVILLLSIVIAMLARWFLVSSLTDGLKAQGLGMAYNVAENCRGYILTENVPELTSLMFDARQGEKSSLIAYVFVVDKENRMLAHSMVREVPKPLPAANPIPAGIPYSIKALEIDAATVYDIAVPVKEGIYQIGTVHVGLQKSHIDALIGRLRTTFLGFIAGITILFFWISHLLAKQVTRPIFHLVRVADEISRGNLDIQPDIEMDIRCWEMKRCGRSDCPARNRPELPCWYQDGTACHGQAGAEGVEKLDICRNCEVYRRCAGDEVAQLAYSFTNMTARLKHTEAEIRRSEDKYRSLFHSGPNPIFVLDKETLQILDANPNAEETYGYSKSELKGMIFSTLGTFDQDRIKQMAHGASAGPSDCVVMEKERHIKKGIRPFFVKLKACPARYRDREVIIVAATDITESIEKEAQFVQASKMTTLGEMSAGIAHELNQPLNAIRMGSDYLKMMVAEKRPIPDSDLTELAESMCEQVDRASQIINHLRNFGRKPDLAQHPVRFKEPIESVLAIIGQQLTLQNIEMQLALDEALPPIFANRNHLEQIFFNLISNARDAIMQSRSTAAGGHPGLIRIRSFRDNDRAVVMVTDNGTGIPEEIRDRIFEPFFTTKDVGKGMGLGLSIIYGLVRDHDGCITVESEPGKNTSFKLSFPLMGGDERECNVTKARPHEKDSGD